LGKRYTEEEKHLIQELSHQGHTDETIAQQIGRSTNAIRNIRHRNNIKTRETQTIQKLRQTKQKLQQQIQQIEHIIRKLEKRRNQTHQALRTEETQLIKKLETQLTRLKHRKPELFTITAQEQINKLTLELATTIFKWLIE
jgi:hypothetical protein